MLMDLPIETERLRLRRYEDRDLADILAYSSDADFWLARNLDWPVTEEGVKAYWEAQREVDPEADPAWFSLVVELKAEGKAIGQVGIGVIKMGEQRQGTAGWLLGRQYQGQGLATEGARALMTYGFDHLGLHRIAARTGSDNERSWRLMERLGMRREAHFRESQVVEGAWRDEYVYAVLADEWRGRGGQASGEGQVMVNIIQGERAGRRGRLAVGCSAAILDPTGQRMLLIRRADSGRWAVPGGYTEPGESLTEACAREVLEETGVRVRVGRLVAVYASPHVLVEYADENRYQPVVLHFVAEAVGGALRAGEETTEVGYYARGEIEQMEMSGLDRQRVEDGFAGQMATVVREDFSLL